MTTPTSGLPDYLSGGTGGSLAAQYEKAFGLPPGYFAAHPDMARAIAKNLGIDPSLLLGPDPNATAIGDIYNALPPSLQQGQGYQLNEFNMADPTSGHVWVLQGRKADGSPNWVEQGDTESKRILASFGLSPSGIPSGGGGGGGGGMADDPRYWDIQYQKLYQDALNMGLDSESARRQALTTLITNRNNTALGVAQTSSDVAKNIAEFAANPRDTYAEALYRNQVGGTTPFGDTNNSAFGEYGKALAEKAASIFQPVGQDLNLAREYARSIPPVDFLSPAPAVQQVIGGGGGGGSPASPAAAPANGLQQLMDRLNSMTPQEQTDFRKWTTAGQPQAMMKGGKMDVGDMTRFGGYQPSSSEGGTNMNVHEPVVIMGIHSKHVYATAAEGGYPEQIIVKPTPSGKKAAMEAEKAKKSMDGMMTGAKPMATGGSVSATPDEMLVQFQKLLERLGGPGGGTSDPFGGTRQLAGAPANAIMADPFLKGITEATYSMKGIRPEQLWADIAKFSPKGIVNNAPRIAWA